ncbi:MAG: SPFH domain-containing protein, partial [Gemmatimonadota bacterium]
MYRERPYPALNGILMAVILVAVTLGLGALVQRSFASAEFVRGGVASLLFVLTLIGFGGFFIIHPNEAKALVLFGTYKGTVKQDGFWWANPFMTKQAISLRVRNFETAKLKVNDNHANPIEIGAIVVWKVVETAEALFEVDDYQRYVAVQSESALRAVASHYPYDAHVAGEISLSTHMDEVSQALEAALADRLKKAGVEVVEARISHLAYAQEIAAAMLQ